MKRRLLAVSLSILGVLVVGAISMTSGTAVTHRPMYEVTLTNLMRAQQLTPPVILTHNSRLGPVTSATQPLREDLIPLVEDAATEPFAGNMRANNNVLDVQVIARLILPGQSASVRLQFDGSHDRVTLVSMLATTNDGFVVLNGGEGPNGGDGSVSFDLPVYDGGTEQNNEDCAFIPGPFCRNFFVRHPEGSEGFITIHNGIHGGGDVSPAIWDWKNPGARVTINRVQ